MRRLVALLAGALIIASLGCGERASEQSPAAEIPTVDVWTTPVVEERVTAAVVGTGSMAAHKTSNIGPRIDGIIEEIFVRVGDRVEEGAPLFRTPRRRLSNWCR